MQVAPRNTVRSSRQDHNQGQPSGMLLEPHVSHVAFSNDGSVMATVDVRPNAGSLGSDEQTLRFWDQTEAGSSLASSQDQPLYSVNTYLDDPHRFVCLTQHQMLHPPGSCILRSMMLHHQLTGIFHAAMETAAAAAEGQVSTLAVFRQLYTTPCMSQPLTLPAKCCGCFACGDCATIGSLSRDHSAGTT